jgi:hypothetical protein
MQLLRKSGEVWSPTGILMIYDTARFRKVLSPSSAGLSAIF